MGEYRMSVRIDEAGQNYAAAAVNLGYFPMILLKPRIAKRIFGAANRDDLSANAEYGSIANDSEFR
jgi:hypothetical protein